MQPQTTMESVLYLCDLFFSVVCDKPFYRNISFGFHVPHFFSLTKSYPQIPYKVGREEGRVTKKIKKFVLLKESKESRSIRDLITTI